MITYQPYTLIDHQCPYHKAQTLAITFNIQHPSFLWTFDCGDYLMINNNDMSFYMNTKRSFVSSHRKTKYLQKKAMRIIDRIFDKFLEYVVAPTITDHEYTVVTQGGTLTFDSLDEYTAWYKGMLLFIKPYNRTNAVASKILVDKLPDELFIPSAIWEEIKP